MLFAAMHESGNGTKQTYSYCAKGSAFRSKADIDQPLFANLDL
jgi:hypothetical protein